MFSSKMVLSLVAATVVSSGVGWKLVSAVTPVEAHEYTITVDVDIEEKMNVLLDWLYSKNDAQIDAYAVILERLEQAALDNDVPAYTKDLKAADAQFGRLSGEQQQDYRDFMEETFLFSPPEPNSQATDSGGTATVCGSCSIVCTFAKCSASQFLRRCRCYCYSSGYAFCGCGS